MKNASSILLVVVSLFLSSCASLTAPKPGAVQHVVLAWLKKPGNDADRAKLIEAAKGLKAGIPQVQSLHVGRVVMSDRDVVDDSFDIALVMGFKSKADLDAYEKSPVHVKAVTDTLKPLTSKIVVHDFLDQ